MLYLSQALFPWLLTALLLGLATGWWSCRQRPSQSGVGWLGALIAAFAVGALLAATTALPGRTGLWLDTGLLFAFWYLAGCCLGCLFGRSGAVEAEPAAAATVIAAPSAPAIAAKAPAAPVAAPPEGFQWQASKDGGTVTLTGAVASDEARAGILAAAKRALPGAVVQDRMEVGADAPAGFEPMAEAAFGHLAALERGVASLIGGRYTLAGVATQSTDRDALTKSAGALPSGFSLARVDIGRTEAPAADPERSTPSSDTALPGERPPTFAVARGGKADDLKRIRGIGRQNEQRLQGLGIWHYDQIAAWTTDQALWVGAYLAFPGRIEREGWVEQARLLAEGQETDFSKRVAKGEVATSQSGAAPASGASEPGGPARKPRGDRKPKV